ncbi:hypothetical protein GP475_03490 [Corynebacterium poyangense]|uniref:Uncharacterized protein n=1 Tax=Corynebacterium poyangense TaxID=2684405 RepID=A0A7H0SMP2_9CORY|nr:hypothetical protein [Corynebacterium poyangense]MBZ8176925.1 hypothetical protein [Corynebacterium poyangense]QNQ89817.1 hypothetical protein GP475_03490 [Corynebacterium poyangense]
MSCGQADTMCFDVTHALIGDVAKYAAAHPEESAIPREFKDIKVTYKDASQGEDTYNCQLGTYSTQSSDSSTQTSGEPSIWECRSQENPRQLWCGGHCFSAAVPNKGTVVPPQQQMSANDPYWKERAQIAQEKIAATSN